MNKVIIILAVLLTIFLVPQGIYADYHFSVDVNGRGEKLLPADGILNGT